MKVYTSWHFGTDEVDVWVYEDAIAPPRHLLKLIGGNEWERVEVHASDRPAPSFRLPGDMFKALVAAGSDLLPPSAATERHLADAIKVRDRLLDKVVPPR